MAFATTVIGVIGVTVPGSASASYPGRAGTVAFQEYSGDIDENGVETDEWDVRFVHPSGHVTTRLSCEGIDLTDFSGHGTQYCPRFRQDYGPDKGLNYSPDGGSLVVAGASYQDDGRRTPPRAGCPGACDAIIMAAADGSTARLLPVTIADAVQPAFMPSGSAVIFSGKTGRGVPFDLYTVATDGTHLARLTSDGASEPAPCANRSIVYVHRGDLYLRTPDGHARRLTRHGGTQPDCSPDSGTIAFVRAGALYTIRASGHSLRRLTPLHVVDGRPAFSPAGELIAVTTTTRTRGCETSTYARGEVIDRLDLIDPQGRRRRSRVIDRQDCGQLSPGDLGTTAWQPLPAPTR